MRRPVVLHLMGESEQGSTAAARDAVRATTSTRAVEHPPGGSVWRASTRAPIQRVAVVHCHSPARLEESARLARQLRRPLVLSLSTPDEAADARLSSALSAVDLVVAAADDLVQDVPARVVVVRTPVALTRPPGPTEGPPGAIRVAVLRAELHDDDLIRVVAADAGSDALVIRSGSDPACWHALNALAAGTLVLTDDDRVAAACGGAAVPMEGRSVATTLRSVQADPEDWAWRLRAGRQHVARFHERGARVADLERLWRALSSGDAAVWVSTPPEPATARVVMVTHNRRELLGQALAALSRQTRPPDEVVVVDNGSTDGTAEVLRRHEEAGSPAHLRVITQPANLPVAEGRNLAAAGATTDVIVFTDDDCRPRQTWLECLLAGMSNEIDLVQGRTVPDPSQPLQRLSRSQSTPAEFGLYETCNIAYRREAFERVGGFDLALAADVARHLGPRWERFPFGEDTDLAWRAKASGSRTAFAVDAVVDHEVFAPDVRLLIRRASLSAGFPVLVRRVPELRRDFLTLGFVLGRHRVKMWLAIIGLGVVVALRQPVWVLLLIPYGDSLLGLRGWHRRMRRRSRLREGAVLLVRDLVETAALLRGCVLARRIVL